MSEMTVSSAILLGLLDEISRHRALADHETDLIEAIVVCQRKRDLGTRTGERTTFKWTLTKDRALLRSAKVQGGIKRFAARHGITPNAASSRLRVLRKTTSCETAAGRVG